MCREIRRVANTQHKAEHVVSETTQWMAILAKAFFFFFFDFFFVFIVLVDELWLGSPGLLAMVLLLYCR